MRWSDAEIVDLSVREELLDASGLRNGRVLDVGMGGGTCMARLLVQHGFDVVGVDRSADAVREYSVPVTVHGIASTKGVRPSGRPGNYPHRATTRGQPLSGVWGQRLTLDTPRTTQEQPQSFDGVSSVKR